MWMVLLLVPAFSTRSISQQASETNTAAATVTFTLDFPHSDPEHYTIAVDSTGHAHFECTGVVVAEAEEQTYETEFEMSPAGRQKVFEWARQAKYFEGNLDSGNRKLAFTGTKILKYQDGQHNNTTKYDYSNVAPVRDLTSLFQNMATTLEYGQRIAYYHRYQKLALDDELKRMEAQAKDGTLSELQSVVPLLQELVDDNSVINGVRVRAKGLIEMAGRNQK
jgi:hypothetical protein